MIAYLDSSVLLRRFFDEPDQISDISPFDRIYSSVILRIECKRVLHRVLQQQHIAEEQYAHLLMELSEFISRVRLIDFAKQIQRRAEEPFVFPIGSLDAIHLSSALMIRNNEEIAFLTHDSQLGKNARALDFMVLGI